MNCTLFIPGKCHPLLINLSGGIHDASRISVRLRIATGTYILQRNRASYSQFETDATYNLCGDADETLSHFLLECKAFQMCRQPIVTDIKSACDWLCGDLGICTLDIEMGRLTIDCSCVLAVYPDNEISQLQEIQFHSAQLCYALHCLCFKKLGFVPKCKRRICRRRGSFYKYLIRLLVPLLLREEVHLRRRNLQYTVTVMVYC